MIVWRNEKLAEQMNPQGVCPGLSSQSSVGAHLSLLMETQGAIYWRLIVETRQIGVSRCE